MISLIVILIAIALVDSTSMVPIGLVPMATILAGNRPVKGALSFICGIFFVYFVSGLLLLVGFDLVFDEINPSISRWWHQPNTAELVVQLVIGFILLFYAWKQYRRPAMTTPDKPAATPMSSSKSFIMGASLTVIGVPGAIPYFGAIEQILRADLGYAASLITLIIYNIVFVAPFFALLLVRLLAPNQSEVIFNAIAAFIRRWGKPVIVSCLVLLSVTLVADSIGWFLGFPLLPINVQMN